jgi:hypothetical protein
MIRIIPGSVEVSARDNETRDDSLVIDSGPWVSVSAIGMQVTSTPLIYIFLKRKA